MALQQVNTTTITSPTASFNIGGIDDDSVYMLSVSGANVSSQNGDIFMRVGTSSGADTSGNYDYVAKNLYSGGVLNNSNTNVGYWNNVFLNMQSTLGSGNAIMYLYNWNNSSKYSTVVFDNVHLYTGASHPYGVQGGGIHTVAASQTDVYLGYGGNISSGTFTLYRVV
tara:strand:- start:689 stop:1192 length:504 start_codon:yes stop_codon:yes gene_type:complete